VVGGVAVVLKSLILKSLVLIGAIHGLTGRSGRTRRRLAPLISERKAVVGFPIGFASRRSAWARRSAGLSRPPPGRCIALPDQARELRKRIAATVGPIIAISHRTCSDSGALLRFLATHPHDCSGRPPAAWSYRISSGAPTPSNESPDPRTVTTPCTSTRRAIVNSRSSGIMKRKCGDALPSVHNA
jgi:hypothetical protein